MEALSRSRAHPNAQEAGARSFHGMFAWSALFADFG